MTTRSDDLILVAEVGAESIDTIMKIMTRAFDPEFGEAWNSVQCLGILGLPHVWIAVAAHDGQPCGFSISRVILDEAELLLIATDPDCRERGVGKRLLEYTMNVAREHGAARMHLEVRDGNPAMRLYEHNGFKIAGRRRDYYRGVLGQAFDALTLVRSLGNA